jgi:hypothetical protein
MNKIYYNEQGWVCERYPYDIPIEDETRFIEVDDSVYDETYSCESFKSWRVVNGKLVIEQYEDVPEEINLNVELEQIQNWFRENDWIPNKIITGEWEASDAR